MLYEQKYSNIELKKCFYLQFYLLFTCPLYSFVKSVTLVIIYTNCIMYFSNLYTNRIDTFPFKILHDGVLFDKW